VVTRLRKRPTFRVIAHRPYDRPIAARLPSVSDVAALDTIEALTNPRVRQEWSARKKIRPEDVGDTLDETVMASFVYSGPSRFTDGSFGVYYAGFERETAIAESRFHTERFLVLSHTPATNVFKRVLRAEVSGSYDDIRALGAQDPIYTPDPDAYAAAQSYALGLYARNREDGIVYRSVRQNGGTCVVAFRPRLVTDCTAAEMLMYAYDGARIDAIMRVEELGAGIRG
jgi:RES domain